LGPDFEKYLSVNSIEPFWIVDFPINMREFYDREYDEYPGVLCDMDLVYPEGYGEALSGGEREFKYEKILRRMAQSHIYSFSYRWYLDFAQKGLYPSAGFGIGLERLTRYICALDDISLSTIFPKKPGAWNI
jgi:asparaginyl-tRNA synthetase